MHFMVLHIYRAMVTGGHREHPLASLTTEFEDAWKEESLLFQTEKL